MSKLEELIQELCPDGVEYKKIGDIAIESKEKNKNREFSEVRTVTNESKLVRTSDYFDRNITSEDTSGYMVVRENMFVYNPSRINIGSIAYSTEMSPVILSPMYVVFSVPQNILLNKFLLLYLKSGIGMHKIQSKVEPGARFRLPFNSLAKIIIPVPPLEVQQEIVRILDSFTELTTELTAELTARKQQFEYYRSKLYEFKSDVKWAKTTDLVEESFWLMPATPNYIDSGVPYITSKNIKNNSIDFENVKYISFTDYISISANRAIKEGDMLITMIGTIGEAAFVGSFTDFYGQNMYLLRLDKTKINKNFFYYYFTSPRIRSSLISKKNASSQGYIKAGSIENLKVPIPSMDLQNRIVDILDKFNSLCNNLSDGLPAEIEARQKQYKYYRDKLLTFKKLA